MRYRVQDPRDVVPILRDAGRHIPREVALEAYKEYAAQFGTDQSFERLHERGGFSPVEMCMLLFQRIKRIEAEQKGDGSNG